MGDAGLLARLARTGALATGLASAMLISPVRVAFVSGHSMQPTLAPGQPLLYRPLSASQARVRDGEVILLRLGGQVCVKRVYATGGEEFWTVGLPGGGAADGVPIRRGSSMRGWRRRFPEFRFRRVRLPEGSVYVMGDNVGSLDSRTLGPAPESEVLGRVIYPSAASDPPPPNSPMCYELPPAPPGRNRS